LDHSTSEALAAFGYELVELLGSGGMGQVWRAHERSLDRDVAIKILGAGRIADRHHQRFLREARALARINHPNVVVVYRLGEILGLPFLAYELIEGVGVDQLIGSLRWPRALAIAIDLARGLTAVHEAGILHRDLKPANAMVTADGTAKLIDFGLAKLLHEADGVVLGERSASDLSLEFESEATLDASISSAGVGELTEHGALLGTPRYIAPELWHGAPATTRSDAYTLGLIAWEMLTHERVHAGAEGVTELCTLIDAPLRPVVELRPEVPVELAAVVDKAVSKDPSARHASAAELSAALERVAETLRGGGRLSRRGALLSSAARREPSTPTDTPRTVAVLPFTGAGDDEAREFAEGLREELIDSLSDTLGVELRLHAGLEPGSVELLLEASVRCVGDRIRIRVRLIPTHDDGTRPAALRFDCTRGDLFEVSDEITDAVTTALADHRPAARPDAAGESSELHEVGPTSGGWDPAGVDLYLEARRELRRGWHTDVSLAIELFGDALTRLPGSPRVLAGAAIARARLAFIGGPDDGERALGAVEFAERAIALDPTRSEPHYALAIYHYYRGAPKAAIAALERALELAPASAEVHDLLGRILLEIEELERAIHHLELALRLDPCLLNARIDLARAHALAGAWEESDALLALPPDEESDAAVLRLTAARLDMWRSEPRWLPADDGDLGPGLLDEITAIFRAAVRTHARDPSSDQRLRQLADQATGSPRRRILTYQTLAELAAINHAMDDALAAVERAVEFGLFDLTWLLRCPPLAPLHDEPRFIALAEQLRARVHRRRG
jgi:eukaryotic-like serine/threonine-protein kinase